MLGKGDFSEFSGGAPSGHIDRSHLCQYKIGCTDVSTLSALP